MEHVAEFEARQDGLGHDLQVTAHETSIEEHLPLSVSVTYTYRVLLDRSE